MINPKVQFAVQDAPKDAIEHAVIKAALAVLPRYVTGEIYSGSTAGDPDKYEGLAIDRAFEIAHAFVRASGFVLNEKAPEA